jgi:transposase
MGQRRGESRRQAALFPVMLDELVAQDGLVRVVDAWVGSLDVKALGFGKAQAQVMGAPPYDPADLLKLYIWGYLSAIRSSRALERECHRNVECMWLLGRLAPEHKTIAEFRRSNTQALVAVCAADARIGGCQKRVESGSTGLQHQKSIEHERRHLDAPGGAGLRPICSPQRKCPARAGHSVQLACRRLFTQPAQPGFFIGACPPRGAIPAS